MNITLLPDEVERVEVQKNLMRMRPSTDDYVDVKNKIGIGVLGGSESNYLEVVVD